MELSNPIQADILHIQEQLKSAIHDHQDLVLQLKLDCENVEIKQQLRDLQNYIMFLGASQKRLLQDLRHKLDGGGSMSSASSTCSDSSQFKSVTHPVKRARLLTSAENFPCRSSTASPEAPSVPSPICNNSPRSTREQSPPLKTSPAEQKIKASPSTRSSRLLTSLPRTPSPPCTLPPCFLHEEPESLDRDLEAAVSCEGSLGDRQICFLNCLGLVTLERAAELMAMQNQLKPEPSPMNPFIMINGLDPSQKRRRETYLLSGSPRKSRHSDDSSPERDSRSPSIPRRNSDSSQGSEDGSEHDQLFTEHLLDTLLSAEQRPFTLMDTDSVSKQVLVDERERLLDVQEQLSEDKELLEEKRDMLAHAIQEQDKRRCRLLESEAQTRKSIENVQKFVAFFHQSDDSSGQISTSDDQ